MAVRKEGAFVEIALPNGKFGYGRILPKASFAFYNINSNVKVTNVEYIRTQQILFITSVYKHAVTKGRWPKIGFLELELNLQTMPLEFIQDPVDASVFNLYDPNTGEITPTTKDKCIGLEQAAVWEPKAIESRLIDHFEGRPNVFVEQSKIK